MYTHVPKREQFPEGIHACSVTEKHLTNRGRFCLQLCKMVLACSFGKVVMAIGVGLMVYEVGLGPMHVACS